MFLHAKCRIYAAFCISQTILIKFHKKEKKLSLMTMSKTILDKVIKFSLLNIKELETMIVFLL